MRVIGGSARGRPIRAPSTTGTRPTSDRVREAMFDILGSLTAIEDMTTLDLFAGSGALGIEAASRGSSAVTFVEQDRKVARVIEDNLERTGLRDEVTVSVLVMEAFSYLQTTQRSFDLALIDPPYSFEDWPRLLALIDAQIVVCESKNPVTLPEHLVLHRVYRYGTTLLTVAISPKHRVLEARS